MGGGMCLGKETFMCVSICTYTPTLEQLGVCGEEVYLALKKRKYTLKNFRHWRTDCAKRLMRATLLRGQNAGSRFRDASCPHGPIIGTVIDFRIACWPEGPPGKTVHHIDAAVEAARSSTTWKRSWQQLKPDWES
jgi:hypothetical protein